MFGSANGLDLVPIRVQDERAVIILAVLGTQARGAIVAGPRRQPRGLAPRLVAANATWEPRDADASAFGPTIQNIIPVRSGPGP